MQIQRFFWQERDVCSELSVMPQRGRSGPSRQKSARSALARWRWLGRLHQKPEKCRRRCFKRSRTVGVHFGLTRYQSGEHDNPGRISKAGDRDVRAALYAAANALLMRTMAGSQIKSWGMRLMRTKGRRRAVVAVARKLAVLLHRMWIDGTEFRQDQVGGTA